jgi:hypothetical protein
MSAKVKKAILTAIEDGALSKACKILDSMDLPPVRDEGASLRELYPMGPEHLDVDDTKAIGNLDFTPQLLDLEPRSR